MWSAARRTRRASGGSVGRLRGALLPWLHAGVGAAPGRDRARLRRVAARDGDPARARRAGARHLDTEKPPAEPEDVDDLDVYPRVRRVRDGVQGRPGWGSCRSPVIAGRRCSWSAAQERCEATGGPQAFSTVRHLGIPRVIHSRWWRRALLPEGDAEEPGREDPEAEPHDAWVERLPVVRKKFQTMTTIPATISASISGREPLRARLGALLAMRVQLVALLARLLPALGLRHRGSMVPASRAR